MRSMFKGSLSCGVLNVPVKMYGATEEKTIRFNQIHRECGSRISMPKHCPVCDKNVDSSELDKGYEVSKGQYVIFQPEELQSLKLKSISSIEIQKFIEADDMDPRMVNKSYFLSPDKGGAKAFTLLLRGMEDSHLCAVAKVVIRDKERVTLIRPFDSLLLLQTLFYKDELREWDEIRPEAVKISDQEAGLAKTLITKMIGSNDLSEYTDSYRQAVESAIEAKLSGSTIETPEAPKPTGDTDLVDQLVASIGAVEAK